MVERQTHASSAIISALAVVHYTTKLPQIKEKFD